MEPKVLTSSDIDVFLQGQSSALTEPKDKNIYSFETGQGELTSYDENLTPYLNKENNRADNQTAFQALRNGVSQLITGALGEVVATPGYVAGLFEPIEEMDKGFSGFFLEAGEAIKEAGQDFAPIHQSQSSQNKVFAPWNSEWMANTISQFGPTVALVGATLLTEGAATPALLRMLSKVPQIGKYAKVASQLKNSSALYKNLRTINSTLLSRNAEAGMEAYQTFEEVYNTLKQENPELSDEQMRQMAGEAGSQVWKKNWALTALDYFQYKGLLEGFGKFNKFGSLSAEMLSEAGEEGMQYTFQKEAKDNIAFQLGKTDEDKNTIETFIDSLSDKEMQKAMVQGALGGAVFQGAGVIMNKVTQALYNRQNKPLQNNVVETVAEAVEKGDDITLIKDIETELSKPDITPEHRSYLNNVKDTINIYKTTLETVDTPYKKEVSSMYAQAELAFKSIEEVDKKIDVVRNNKSINNALQAVTYAEATLARNTIGTLKNKYKDAVSQNVLEKLEKKYETIVEEMASPEINESATKVVPLIRTNIQKKLQFEFEAERHLQLGSEVAEGRLDNFQEQIKKTEIEQLKIEKDIDKLLAIRDSEDVELSKVAKSRLKELHVNEDKVIPETIEELVPFYEKNPLTFKASLKEYGLPKETTLEDFNNISQTDDFIQHFEKKQESKRASEKLANKKKEVAEEVQVNSIPENVQKVEETETKDVSNQPSVELDNTTTEDKEIVNEVETVVPEPVIEDNSFIASQEQEGTGNEVIPDGQDEWQDVNANKLRVGDAITYSYDFKTEEFVTGLPFAKRHSVEEFNSLYQNGKAEKGYHVLYDKGGNVVFYKEDSGKPLVDIDFIRNLYDRLDGKVFDAPVTLHINKNYKNGKFDNSKAKFNDVQIEARIGNKIIGKLPALHTVQADQKAMFETIRRNIYDAYVASGQDSYDYPITTTIDKILPARFWQGPRTTDIQSLTKDKVILGYQKQGQLIIPNTDLSEKELEALSNKFKLSEGHVYWMIKSPITGEYIPYRLFTKKVKDVKNADGVNVREEQLKKLVSEITPENWSNKRIEIQKIVRWKDAKEEPSPNFFYVDGKLIAKVSTKDKEGNITTKKEQVLKEDLYNFFDLSDKTLQVDENTLNRGKNNDKLFELGYFEATLNAGLFHSPSFTIDLEKLQNKEVPKAMGYRKPKFSIKTNEPTTTWNEKEETQWFKDRLGEVVDLNVVDEGEMDSLVESLKHIHGQDNLKAWGFFHNAAVWISKNAKSGTTQHEAFHVIFNLALTKTQQESLLNWGSKEYGIDRNKKGDELMFSIAQNVNEAQIEYALKIVDALNKVQRNKFESSKLQGWINDLSKYGVTKQQLEIFQEYAKDGMTKEEIIASISADLSFVVESNITTVKKEGQIDSQKNITSNEFEVAWNSGEQLYDNLNSRMVKYNGVIYTHYKDLNVYIKPTEKEDLFQPTTFYSSLTVPGGTHYTENEIRTPQITPNIKGHSQFSTDSGIGWFRSDDRTHGGQTALDHSERVEANGEYDKFEEGFTLGSDIYKQISRPEVGVPSEYWDTNYKNGKIISDDEYYEAKSKANIDSFNSKVKIRRILELQSDLFQKGRDREDLIGNKATYNIDEYLEAFEMNLRKADLPENIIQEQLSKQKEQLIATNTKENQFLQLLNKNNNWVTFFIKSIIQDSQKKGYEKVLFPKGETAAKIEGHDTLANEIVKQDGVIKQKQEYINAFNAKIFEKNGFILKKQDNDILAIASWNENVAENITKQLQEAEQKKQELKSQGLEKLKPIEGFYEVRVGNVIKKNYKIKEVVDEYGNGWWEIDLTSMPKETILLSTSREEYYKQLSGDTQIEEKLADAFAEYVQMAQVDETKLKQTPWYKQLGATIKRLFRKMYSAMKAAVGLNLSQEEIFFRINNKSYKNFKPKRNVEKFAPSAKAYINSVKQQDRVNLVNREFIELYNEFKEEQKKKDSKLKDRDIITKAIKITQDENLFKKLAEQFRHQNVALRPLLEEGEIDSTTYEYLVKEYNEMADKLYKDGIYGDLYYNALSDLKKFNIRVNVLKGDLERDENQDTKETWMEADESPFESFTALLKQGLGTLLQGEFTGNLEEGGNYKKVIYEEKYDDMGQPRYVDVNEAYAALLENAHGSLNEDDMMSKIKDLTNDYPWAVQLHKVLSESVNSSIITNPQLFKNQLYYIGLQSPMPTFKYLLELFDNGARKWVFANSSAKGLVGKLKKEWTTNLAKESSNKLLKNGEINKVNLEAVKTRLKNKENDVKLLHNVLNYIGITIPLDAVNNIVGKDKGDLQKWTEQVFNNLASDKISDEGLVSKAIVKIAELAKKYYKEYNQASHTSVDNEMVNNYIRNSFMARTIEKFKRGQTDFYRVDPFYARNDNEKNEMHDDSKDLWLDRFETSFRDKLEFALVDGVKNVSGQSTLFPDMSRLEFEAFSLNAFYNNGNGLPKNKGVGKGYYSAQLMADSSSHALIGFETYTNEDVLTKLVEVVHREYNAILEHRRNPMTIKLNAPKFMFVPEITEEDFDETNPNYLIDLRDKIKKNLDKVVVSQMTQLEKLGIIGKNVKTGKLESGYISQGVDISALVESFVYNDYFAQTQIISLFHGKLFMYKSMEDFYKRAKEIWSPGNFINSGAKDVNGVKINKEFFTLFVESEGLNYSNNKEAIDTIMNNYRKIGLNEDLVLENGAKYGYTDGGKLPNGKPSVTLSDGRVIESSTVDSTDAQGIIDIHRWKEISLGKGIDPVEVERVYQAIITDTYKVTDLTMVLNPFKQFYYQLNQVTNDKGTVVVPTQIKNSEYVLIPQVAKGNPELELILAKLEATRKQTGFNGSINFNSAVKVGERNLNKDIKSIEPTKAIRLLNEEYRIQGEVPEHQVDTENLLGTQFRKLIVGDISLEEFYEVADDSMTGSALKDEWNALLIAHIEDAFEELNKTFDNDVEFYKELQKEAESKDMPQQYIEALTLVDGKPRMNLSSPMLIKKSVSLISSIYRNRITKIKFPGASMPNVTAYGFEKEPKIVYKKDGSVDYFEAYMPLTFQWLADYMDEGGFVKAEKLKELGLDMGIAYRIPTENKYSMIPIKIIGFTNAGIALPKNITAVAGLDFDIDKMYIMLYSFKVIKDKDGKAHPVKVKYDKTKSIRENSRDARNNRMMDIALGVLRDKKTAQALMIPGGFVELKEEANRIAKIKGKDKETINPMTLEGRATIFERMMAGKKLIGIPANYNSTHALMQDTGLALIKPVLFNGQKGSNLGAKYIMKKEKASNIQLLDLQIGQQHEWEGYKIEIDKITDKNVKFRVLSEDAIEDQTAHIKPISAFLNEVNNFEDSKTTVTSEIAQFLASVVDNGKDPLANLYNLNTYTADVVMLITKFFGKEVAMKFSAQPAVVKFYEIYTNLGSNSKAELEAALQVLKIGKKDYYDMLKAEDIDITDKQLEDGLRDNPDSGSQKLMLQQFLRYKKNQAKDLGKLVNAIKVPDNGMRSTLEKTIGGIDRVTEAKELQTITGIVDFFNNEKYANNTMYAKGITEAMNRLIRLKFPDFQSEDSAWLSIRNQINEENDALIGEKDLTLLHDSAMTYLSAGFEPLMNIDRLKVIKETPELLRQLLAKDTSQYSKLLNSLEINTSDVSGYDVITLTSGLGKDAENDIINQWENMKNSADPLENKFGNMLIEYAFVTNGFRFSPGSLAHIQPISFYENMRDSTGKNYNEFMEQQIASANTDKLFLNNYLQQFIRHYFPRLSWVKEFDNKTASIRYDEISKEPYSVELDSFGDRLRNGEMPKYVKVKSKELKKTFLFKHDGLTESKYYRVESLGIYREFEEFVYDNPQESSTFPQNNMKSDLMELYDKVVDVEEVAESTANVEIGSSFEKNVPIEITSNKYTRDSVEVDNSSMYLFTDNAERTSAPNATIENVDKNSWYYKKYKSLTNKPIHFGTVNNPTSAVIRGLNNAYPISTMSAYGTNWTNSNFELFKETIDSEIEQIKTDLPRFKSLKIGNYRIGQGGLKAKLPIEHQTYLDSKLLELGIDNSGTTPIIINNKSTGTQLNLFNDFKQSLPKTGC